MQPPSVTPHLQNDPVPAQLITNPFNASSPAVVVGLRGSSFRSKLAALARPRLWLNSKSIQDSSRHKDPPDDDATRNPTPPYLRPIDHTPPYTSSSLTSRFLFTSPCGKPRSMCSLLLLPLLNSTYGCACIMPHPSIHPSPHGYYVAFLVDPTGDVWHGAGVCKESIWRGRKM